MTEIIQPIVGRSIASVQSGGLDDGYQELVIAIIKQAEKDYEGVLLRLFSRPTGTKRMGLLKEKAELEDIFHSQWYQTLTEVDGDKLIELARLNAVEKAKVSIRRKQKKKLKEMEKAERANIRQ